MRPLHDSSEVHYLSVIQYTVAVNIDQRSIRDFCQTRSTRFPMRFAIIHAFTSAHICQVEAIIGST